MDPKIPPSISQLFHTNSVPSLADTPRIRRLLAQRKDQLATLAEQIERARAEVHRLEQQRDQVQCITHELEALMTPIRHMPTDIMARIFEHCILDQPTPRADPRVAPLLLAQVCRSWRYLLFSLPCVWTALQLELPSTTTDWEALVQSKTLSMHFWFSRSKALPISLRLNHTKGALIPWQALVQLDKEILSLGCRLQELSLHFSPRSLSSLLTFAQSPLPQLQHLELQSTSPLPTSDNPPPIMLHSAPSLRSLSLSWCTLDLRHFQVPWVQLQHLNLEYDASAFWNAVHSDYLHTLSRCPNLTTLSLGIGTPLFNVDPTHVVPVTLTRLHTLKTSIFVQTPYLSYLFDALRLPSLRHFDIKNVSPALGTFAGQTECLPLLMRCAETLESVCFDRVDIADAAIMACLEQLSRLKTLSILPGVLRLNHGLVLTLVGDAEGDDDEDEDDLVVEAWRGVGVRGHGQADGRTGGLHVCPTLEVLHLRCSSVVSVDAITRLVSSRSPKLRRFSLQLATFDYGLDTRDDKIRAVRTRLRTYVEGGLELVLTKTSHAG